MGNTNNSGFITNNNYQQENYGDVKVGTIHADFKIEDFPNPENIQGYNNTVIAEEFNVFENSDENLENENPNIEKPEPESSTIDNQVEPFAGTNAQNDNINSSSNGDGEVTQTNLNNDLSTTSPEEHTNSSTPSSNYASSDRLTNSTTSSSTGSGLSNSSVSQSTMGGTGMAAGGMMAGGMASSMSSGGMGGNSMSSNNSLGKGTMSTLGGQSKDSKEDEKSKRKQGTVLTDISDEEENSTEEENIKDDPNGTITETGTTYKQENEEAETLYDIESETEQ